MEFGTLRAALAALLAAGALAACGTLPAGPAGVPRMGVRTFLDIRHLCSLGVSPPIELDRAPAAARYRIRFVNVSVLYSPPADFEVAAEGPAVAEAALDGYSGPCPGEAQSSNYRVEVLAIDARGAALAYGQTTVNAISTTRLMRLAPDLRPRMPPREG
jgi:hypothetical protein